MPYLSTPQNIGLLNRLLGQQMAAPPQAGVVSPSPMKPGGFMSGINAYLGNNRNMLAGIGMALLDKRQNNTVPLSSAFAQGLQGEQADRSNLLQRAAQADANATEAYLVKKYGITPQEAHVARTNPAIMNNYLNPAGHGERYKSISKGGVIWDAKEGKFIEAPSAPQSDDVKMVADAIANGHRPPVLTGLYGKATAVSAELERRGYNYSKANQDWTATQKYLLTLNGPQQVRLRQSVGMVQESLPLVKSLVKEWDAGGFADLNRVNIDLAKRGLLGQDAQSIASRLEAEIADFTSELGTVYKGGNSSTDESLRLAMKQLDVNMSSKTMNDLIDLAEKNIGYRANSLNAGTAGIADSQYDPRAVSEPPPEGSGEQPNPAAPVPAGAPPPGVDPNVWNVMTPDEKALWN